VSKFSRPKKYGLVAVLSAAVDWTAFTALMLFMGGYHIYAQMISRIVGGLFSFLTNKYWSFDSTSSNRVLIEGRRFLLLCLMSYSLAICLFYLFSNVMGISPYIAKFMADTSCMVMNFVVMQAYVFHDRSGFSQLLRRGLKKLFR